MNFTYTSYKPNELNEFIELYFEAFDRKYVPGTYKWQFIDSPQGFLVSNARSETNPQKLAGTSSGVILAARFKGENLISCRIQNSMTAQDYRGYGLFKQTTEDLSRQFFEQGGAFMVTYPTRDISMHTFKSLNYVWFPIHIWQKKIKRADISIVEDRFVWSDSPEFSKADEELIEKSLSEYSVFQTKDKVFLNWRYGANPDKKYFVLRAFDGGHLKAILVYKIYQKELDIVEFFCRDDHSFYQEEMFNAIEYYAHQHGCEMLNIWSMPHYNFHRFLNKNGYEATDSVTNISFKLNPAMKFNADALNNFYFSFGDSDVY